MDETTEPTAAAEAAAAAVSAQDAVHTVGVTKSKTHGRIRMRLDKDHRSPEDMARFKAQLELDERVKEVVVNERTGSVTVKHHTGHDGHDILHKALKEAELITEVALEVEPIEEEGEGPTGQAKLDQQIADLMYKADRALYRLSGGRIHARGRILPLSIAGIGVAQIAVYGISLEMLPGPVLIFMAYDIHKRFTKEHPYDMTDEEKAESEATTEAGAEAGAAYAPAAA